jgi:hypothetical protein
MGGSDAMKDGSSCASFRRSPTAVSAAFTAAILPARGITGNSGAGYTKLQSIGVGRPLTVEEAEETVCVFQHSVERVVAKLILVMFVPISRPRARITYAPYHPDAFLSLKDDLNSVNVRQTRSLEFLQCH